jgi:hypothetical protein
VLSTARDVLKSRCGFPSGRPSWTPPVTPRKGRMRMASNAKKKTTMAKLQRENKLRERRMLKQARKEARKLEASAANDEVVAGQPATQEQ